MRKKILVSLLIAVSVTCFSGCGSSSDQGSNTKEEVQATVEIIAKAIGEYLG